MIGRAPRGSGGLGLVMLGVCLAVPVGLTAQQAAAKAAPTKPAQPAELVFVREVFAYPDIARRNPFVPLSTADRGPRFDQLRLMGVIYDDHDPAASVAMLGTSVMRTSQDSTQVSVSQQGQTWYLKVGETTGNVRVVEIRPDFSVVVEVDQFGITQRRVMRMETPGGTQ
jgi:hypothetical protein